MNLVPAGAVLVLALWAWVLLVQVDPELVDPLHPSEDLAPWSLLQAQVVLPPTAPPALAHLVTLPGRRSTRATRKPTLNHTRTLLLPPVSALEDKVEMIST